MIVPLASILFCGAWSDVDKLGSMISIPSRRDRLISGSLDSSWEASVEEGCAVDVDGPSLEFGNTGESVFVAPLRFFVPAHEELALAVGKVFSSSWSSHSEVFWWEALVGSSEDMPDEMWRKSTLQTTATRVATVSTLREFVGALWSCAPLA